MKYKGVVLDVADPDELGRITVAVDGFRAGRNITPWIWPCLPFAGPGYGLYCLPQVGDIVWVETTSDGSWVYTGFCYTAGNPKPVDGAATVRIFRTPAGHQIKLDESGDVEIKHSGGDTIRLAADGKIYIGATASQFALLGQSFQSTVNALISVFNAHTHMVPQASSGILESQPPANSANSSGSSDLSAKVKIQ